MNIYDDGHCCLMLPYVAFQFCWFQSRRSDVAQQPLWYFAHSQHPHTSKSSLTGSIPHLLQCLGDDPWEGLMFAGWIWIVWQELVQSMFN